MTTTNPRLASQITLPKTHDSVLIAIQEAISNRDKEIVERIEELDDDVVGHETRLDAHDLVNHHSPVLFQAQETAGAAIDLTTATPPAAEVTVVFDQEDFSGTGFSYNTSTGILTIGSDLDGCVAMVNVQINVDDCDSRTQVVAELQQDTGGGYATIARSSQYNARDTDQNEGASHINGFLVYLNNGDLFRVRASANVDSGTPNFAVSTFWSMITVSTP